MKKYLVNGIILFLLTLSTSILNAQQFTDMTSISLTGVNQSSIAWGDYDNDGDLDILLTGAYGQSPNFKRVSKI